MNSEKIFIFMGEICGFCTIFAQQNRTVVCCVHNNKVYNFNIK
jgi:hypothetical protein